MRRRTSIAVAWLAAAVILALGAAGIVTALDHVPGGAGRPELTWAADHGVAASLDGASADLGALAVAVGVLGDHGRDALAALVGRDATGLTAAIEQGNAQLDAIDEAAAALRARLGTIPLAAPDRATRFGAATLARYDALTAAQSAVAPLRPAWGRLAAGVLPAVELTGHLLAHDQIAGEAIKLGGAGSYRAAITRIDRATAELTAARAIRDRLAANVDVTTLDEWIARNAAYDRALRDLWDALLRSKGRVTQPVRDAVAHERTARAALPPDARALVVILGDVARGGLNQAVITIEEARGGLLEAVGQAATPPAASPSGAPPTASPPAP